MSGSLKGKVLASFGELTAQQGIYATTMDELSAHAGISKRTLYKYFRSKEEIVDTFFAQVMRDIDWQLNQAVTGKGDPVYKFRQIIGLIGENLAYFGPRILDDLDKHYPRARAEIENYCLAKVGFLEALIWEGIELGYFRPMNVALVSACFMAAAGAVANPDFLAVEGLTTKEAFLQLSDLLVGGMT